MEVTLGVLRGSEGGVPKVGVAGGIPMAWRGLGASPRPPHPIP